MNRSSRKKFLWKAALGFLFWFSGFYLYTFEWKPIINANVVADFESTYQKQVTLLKDELKQYTLEVKRSRGGAEKFKKGIQLNEQSKNEFFVYANDSLALWTNSSFVFPLKRADAPLKSGVYFMENGWYHIEECLANDSIFSAAFKIKNEFRLQNEDLTNEFSPLFDHGFSGQLRNDNTGIPVKNAAGETIFSIVPDDNEEPNQFLELLIFFCYLLGFFILLQLLIQAIQKLLIKQPLMLIILPLLIVLIRWFWLKTEFNLFMSEFELFNPELFASTSITPSLGDLIINVTIFYFLVHFLLKRTRNWFKQGNIKLKLAFFLLPLFLASFYAAFQINEIIYSLVYDSKISFDLERLFELSLYSFLGIALIGAAFYAYFKLLQYIIIQLKKNNFEWNRLAFVWVVTSAIYVVIDLVFYNHSFLTSLWPVILSGSLLWFLFKEIEYKFVHVISIVAFVAFYAAYILQGYADNNERELRIAQAELIAKDKDPFSEFDYTDSKSALLKDSALFSYFNQDFDQSDFTEQLETEYFIKLKDNFDLTFYLFDEREEMVMDFGSFQLKDLSFSRFNEIIEKSAEQSDIDTTLYFVKDYTDKLTYLSKLELTRADTLVGYLITELRSKKFPEDIGLPSLLLEKGTSTLNRLKHYSIAKYVDDKLVSKKGDYAYPTVGDEWGLSNNFINESGYNHYVYAEEEGFKTIVSKKLKSNLSLFTSFSYLLIMFGVLLLIPMTFKQLQTGVSLYQIKLNVKIQFVLIGLILATLIAFAIGAGTFVKDRYSENNTGFVIEKLGSVRTELESKLKKEDELTGDLADYLEYLLKKFSKVFATDINLYNTKGDLLASSQPKIYSKGLISQKINVEAYDEIHLKNKSEFIHSEHIGRLNYLSAYTPFFNQKGEFLAYVNVQYFARQDEIEDQISAFMIAIIDIMVLMLAISTILAITVSNRLTRPLKYIQDSLKSVQIGSTNKPIAYEGTDEIGELVREYNIKVGELQKNAEALAKSERESAWREMAKQVAHEIKNPLTPMKLSIQHLKRSVKVADDESSEKLDRVSKSLIEQIDALTKIANEFSNFAKMPKPNESELSLADTVESAVAVFSEYDEHEIELTNTLKESAIIWADKDLLLRVFNNLIKNAIQASPPEESAQVNIEITESADFYQVSVTDYGKGIEDDAKERIFVPYFTTKSKGTGLGLAMSKQIIENMKGNIWFESKVNEGTTFFVSFPKMNK